MPPTHNKEDTERQPQHFFIACLRRPGCAVLVIAALFIVCLSWGWAQVEKGVRTFFLRPPSRP